MKIGVILDNIGNNQASYLAINHANSIHMQKKNNVVELFYLNLSVPVVRPLCLVNSVDKIFTINDIIIATDLNTMSFLKQSTAKHKVVYLHDLEWLRRKLNYGFILKELQMYKLICGSESHAEVIHQFCNNKPAVIPSFNLSEIINECIR